VSGQSRGRCMSMGMGIGASHAVVEGGWLGAKKAGTQRSLLHGRRPSRHEKAEAREGGGRRR
jgi:hypothetical protein